MLWELDEILSRNFPAVLRICPGFSLASLRRMQSPPVNAQKFPLAFALIFGILFCFKRFHQKLCLSKPSNEQKNCLFCFILQFRVQDFINFLNFAFLNTWGIGVKFEFTRLFRPQFFLAILPAFRIFPSILKLCQIFFLAFLEFSRSELFLVRSPWYQVI